jgi:hypothetical protein
VLKISNFFLSNLYFQHIKGYLEQSNEITYCSATTKTQLKYRYQSCIGTIYEWRHPEESKRPAYTQGQSELTYTKQRKDGAYTIFQLGKVCKHKKLNAYPLGTILNAINLLK